MVLTITLNSWSLLSSGGDRQELVVKNKCVRKRQVATSATMKSETEGLEQ